MDRRACDILWCQSATHLYGMPARMWPCGCESTGKDAGARCTPHLVRLDANRARRSSNDTDCFRHVSAKRHQSCSGSGAVLARAGLNHRQVSWSDADDSGTKRCCLHRAGMRFQPACHEDCCPFAQTSGYRCKGCLCATLSGTGVDDLVNALKHRAKEARFGAARK
jgi:hypothetical protein